VARRQNGSILLCLICAGETSWESDRRLHGSTDLPLAPAGRASITSATEHLQAGRVAMVYHPDTEAAAETARLVALAVGTKHKAMDDLGDPNLGLLEGLSVQAFEERYPKRHRLWEEDPLSVNPPEGEPLAEARARIFAAISRLLKRSRSEEVAVVLGPLGIGLLRCWLADRPASDLWTALKDQPRIERYCLTFEQVRQMEADVKVEAARA
jgi:broad specificity phosphatase PhoE